VELELLAKEVEVALLKRGELRDWIEIDEHWDDLVHDCPRRIGRRLGSCQFSSTTADTKAWPLFR